MSTPTTPIKLFGIFQSPYVQTAILVFKELGIPYELVVVDITKGDHHKEEYLAKNPFATIPAIDVGPLLPSERYREHS